MKKEDILKMEILVFFCLKVVASYGGKIPSPKSPYEWKR